MTSTAWTFPIPQNRVQEFRDLFTALNRDHLSGLDTRAREVGYHRERMWLQPNDDGGAEFIVYLEFDEGVDLAAFSEASPRLRVRVHALVDAPLRGFRAPHVIW
ncbi:hypothetical protein [Nocardiopsis ansamitocini]|uniref:Uncharacterized protein n=1 Tax=Nocardiopsis ansamitocini TaxID=1670832 RepID=A0A9W6P4Z3_9ACTN|nr:hypothetical protein [Nocardiopsis ansamitocini]GLU47108.1 hypothetical protein Nans01_14590 [Nocardiopsis ansamitocini]